PRKRASLRRAVPWVGGVVLLLGQLHCGASSDDSGGGGLDGPGNAGTGGSFSNGGSAGGAQAGNGGSGGGEGPPPPEVEGESSFRAPVATGRYVWTANPDSGRVALIDALSFEVQVVEAGFQPTYIAAVSKPEESRDVAIVLNAGSWDATLLSVREGVVETHS